MAYDTVNATVNGQNIRLLVPTTYNAGAGAPLIIYHHGVGESETALTADALKTGSVNALTDAGYILAGSNAHGENWGNAASLTDYEDLYDYCIANYNILRVAAWSQSMGGMSGLLSVAAGVIPYTNWLGIYPVCDLRDLYDNGYESAIKTAYGIAIDGSDYAAKTAGHDPVLLSGSAFAGMRMRFYASASDTVVDKTENSDAMYALVGGHAQRSLVVCTGDHGDASHFVPVEYVTFFNQGAYAMASKLPAVKNAAFVFRCVLFAQSDNQIKSNPTIASGDWKVSIDGGTFANLTTLPDVDPDSTVQVKVSLSADEMNGDEIMVTAIDAAGAEWHSAAWVIHTAAQTFDTMDTNIDSILTDTGTAGVVLAARTVEGAIDEIEALRLLLAGIVGKATGGGTTTVTFRDTGDSKDRIVLTVDSSGNRSAVTLDAS